MRALAVVLAMESAGLLAVVVYLAIETIVAPASSLPSAIGITVVAAIAAVWVAFVAAGVLRGQAWTRAAVIVVQILIGAVAVGSFQGSAPRPDLGLILLVPAVAALVLVFTKPVLAATSQSDDQTRAY